MKATRAFIVFCEGKHDVAFCRLVFKHFFKAVMNKSEFFSKYPSPFNSLFKANMEKYIARDMSLDMAHKFFLPDWTYVKNDWIILLFDKGGKVNDEKLHQFLYDFLTLFENAAYFPQDAESIITNVKYLFLYDADHKKPDEIFVQLKDNYSKIENAGKNDSIQWITEPFIPVKGNPFAARSNNKAVYIWADPVKQTGTLEEYLLPLFAVDQKEWTEKAVHFIDSTFLWEINRGEEEKSRIAETARRKKAIITALGQRSKPGSSMNVILDQAGLISCDTLWNNSSVRNFVEFLSTFTGIELTLPT